MRKNKDTKRKDLINNTVKLVKPWFFYRMCDRCEDEVKNEKMWRVIIYRSVPYTYLRLIKYICLQCCPTKNGAFYHFNYNCSPLDPPQGGSVTSPDPKENTE